MRNVQGKTLNIARSLKYKENDKNTRYALEYARKLKNLENEKCTL
jgi:hypothetical protein